MEPFGLQLKRERERRGMTLDQVAESTKIGTRFLHAIEEGQLEQLPGGIFNKGFIRAYGRYVGLDEEELIASYLAALGETQAAEPPLQTPVVTSEPGRPQVGVAIVVVLLLVGSVWYGLRLLRRHSSGNEVRTSALPESTRHAAKTMPSPQPASQMTTGPFTVNVRAREGCWILVQVDKNNPEEMTLEAGDQKSIQASDQLTLKVGNAGGVDFSFNGVPLLKQGAEEEVKTLTFRRDGVQQTFKP